jgi:hypothetical protein
VTGVAARVGVRPDTIRDYLGVARLRRQAGEERPGDLPDPDARFGGSPVWRVETIERWVRSRPGRGVGGGRRRGSS